MISQELQLAQHQRINAYMRRSLNMLHMNSLNLYQEITQFSQENPALVIPDDWYDWPQMYAVTRHRQSLNSSAATPIESVQQKNSLQEHLLLQWQNECKQKNEFAIGEKIISNLDNNGFHKMLPNDLFLSDTPRDLYQKVIKKIQVLEPVGCATTDCFESLLIQMQNDGRGLGLSSEDVKNGLKAWSAHYKEKSAQAFQCQSIDELENLMAYMKDYTPYPGSAFRDHTPTSYIFPEFSVQWHQGKLILKESFPFVKNLKFDPIYETLSSEKNKQGFYAKEQIIQAKEFLKILEERESTLRRIVSLVCQYQKDFFILGYHALRPLRQKDIAQQIHMHAATVSRAVHSKYLQTPTDLVPLRSLFSSALNHQGHSISKTAVKVTIQDYLREHNNAISDQKICDKLNAQGYQIARRTVTKYRNELEKS